MIYNLLMNYLAFAFGLIILIFGANYFIKYAVSIAKHLRLNIVVFGAVIIAIGTSLPELAITVESAFNNQPEIIIGNILGSNIANIGLVLGISLLLGKITPKNINLNNRNLLLVILSFVFLGLVLFKLLFWPFGIFLLIIASFLIFDLYKNRDQQLILPTKKINNSILNYFLLILCLTGVIIGSQIVINSSLSIAETWGITISAFAATIIAVGTSLPELAVTLFAIKRKEHGLAIGNIIGSNLFNLVLIGGMGAIITNLSVTISLSLIIFFIFFTIAAYLLVKGSIKPKSYHGAVLICLYAIFVIFEYLS